MKSIAAKIAKERKLPSSEYPDVIREPDMWDRARKIAQGYEDMKHDPFDPRVKRAYDALISETMDQYKALEGTGAKFEFLKPGGFAVIEVPAGPELFDDYDRQLQHFRRYTLQNICSVVEHAGLVVERRNYLGALIYPAFYLAKKLSRRRPKSASQREEHVAKAIGATSRFNAVGHAIMALEGVMSGAIEFPRGIRCVVTARKPS